MTPPIDPDAHYRAREEASMRDGNALERIVLRLSRLRTGGFLLMAVPLLLLETTSRAGWPLLFLLAGGGAAAFVFLVLRHRREKAELTRARLRATLAREGRARLARDWDALPPPPIVTAPAEHPSAGDLDLVGRASLVHLIGRVTTAPGKEVLRRLILDPFALLPEAGGALLERGVEGEPTPLPPSGWESALSARQEALRVLARHPGLREELELLGREAGGSADSRDTRRFLEWARTPGMLDEDRRSLWTARFLGVFTPLALVGWFLGWAPGLLPLIGGIGALALHQRMAPRIHARFDAAEGGEGDLRRWSELLRLAGELPDGSPLLDQLARAVRDPSPGAPAALRRLVRITDTAAIRRSSLAHFPLVAFFAWDLHVLHRLERWRRRYGAAADGWLRTLGELDALAALAGLVHDHPHWAFPQIDPDADIGIGARALGHPLLRPDRCVTNDVEVPGPGTLLLVTGSNMAGKTTLLRAIGANQVLALAGAPVAAAQLRTRPILPWTAMRVRDSLAEGVSYFLAELQRLRRVVEAARATPVLYLLDEILQGTNSAERRTAARIVLTQLLDTGSVGGITTHDLTLADTEALRARSVDIHFREEVVEQEGRRALSFDYRLRPGPATSRNALLLLEMVGLGPDGKEAEAGSPGDPHT